MNLRSALVQTGDVIGERFEIERTVSAGGMGMVYRAEDRLLGGAVAVKVVAGASELAPRFTREIEILAGLRHPGIVRYVAHGTLAAGEPWMAMEWLEGPTLEALLEAGPLSIADSVALAARLAAALGAFHRRGGVHRDVKPGNVVLVGGTIAGATLIDFGVARFTDHGDQLTAPGVIVGTPRYMAPEQIRGSEHVDARADVFSLGCVAFKCLTGRSPWAGDDDLSLLLKILLEEAPPLRAFRKEAPRWLEVALAAMLAKSPEGRPPDGAAVEAALSAGSPSRAPGPDRALELTSDERRVLCLVVTVDRPGDSDPGGAAAQGGRSALRDLIERHGGRVELLADRSLLAVFSGAGSATDLAARASRCALAVAPQRPGAPVVVVTGRAALAESVPVGELIDRAVDLLARTAGSGATPIRLDGVTAGLLGPAFEVGSDDAGPFLLGERAAPEAPRTLLGKPTPCVGRERELGRLLDTLTRCGEEGEARAVLVTAPAGVGKSRLVHELLHRIRARPAPVEVWLARGDPVSVGSPFGMLGQALRRAAGLLDGEPLEARRRKLAARLGRRLGDRAPRVVEFLGELCGAPFPDEDRVQLRAARRDPMVMGNQMQRAFEDLLRAECAAQPVLLVLEDLHWGDGPTVRFVDAALRNLRDLPLFVLAVARPEVRDVFPRLWSERAFEELRLRPLTRRASEDLVRGTLGAADEATIRTLAERADGNAFYLEELIRAVAEDRSGELPETVLAMVQARLERLDPEARRILRAASIFGQRFWRGGVTALVGGASVDGWLSELAGDEVISAAGEARFPGEIEYAFRHALLREAAYGMLTAEDRAVGHRLAGAWLLAAGEGDAMVLAECFERGGERGQAALWYRRAAEQAFEGNDLDLAVVRAERSLACAPGDGAGDAAGAGWQGRTYLLQAQANRWRGQHRDALERGLRAMRALPRGAAPWWEAVAEVVAASAIVPDPGELDASSLALLETELDEAATGEASDDRAVACAVSLARAAVANFYGGHYARGKQLLARSEGAARRCPGDPSAAAHVESARGVRALIEGDVSNYLTRMRKAGESFEQAGDLRSAGQQTLRVGDAHLQLGGYGAAERAFRGSLAEADRLGLPGLRAAAKTNLGLALALQGKLAEGTAAEEEGLALAEGDQRFELTARIYLARIVLPVDPVRAVREIRPVSDDPATPAAYRCYALALLAAASLALGRPAEARPPAELAMDLLGSLGEIEEGASFIHLTWAETLVASGDLAAARRVLAVARDRLLAVAAKITDAALRRSFLERVPENARTLALAEEMIDGGA